LYPIYDKLLETMPKAPAVKRAKKAKLPKSTQTPVGKPKQAKHTTAETQVAKTPKKAKAAKVSSTPDIRSVVLKNPVL